MAVDRPSAPPLSGTAIKTLYLLSVVVFVDTAGVGMIIPVMPELIRRLAPLASLNIAFVGGSVLCVYAAAQFLFSPALGLLSDRYGRRVVLIPAVTMLAASYIGLAYAPSLISLFIIRGCSGIFGSTYTVANAVIADLATPDQRGALFGRLSAAGALGFIVGPALGGLGYQIGGVRMPFLIMSTLVVFVLVACLLLFRETLSSAGRRPITWSQSNPLLALSQTKLHFPLFLVVFLVQLAFQANLALWPFFTHDVFHWSTTQIGLSIAAYGAALIAVQAILAGKLFRRYGEYRSAFLGLSILIPVFVGIGFCLSGLVGIVLALLGSIGGVVMPALQSMLSKSSDQSSQGLLQGAFSSTVSLAAIIGPLAMGALYSAMRLGGGSLFMGGPYLAGAFALIIALIVISRPKLHEVRSPRL